MPEFSVITGPVIEKILTFQERSTIKLMEDTYVAHARKLTVNPDSFFLRFRDKPDARIIALPAHIGCEPRLSGIKWISSFPSNHERHLPRASAVLILNDADTGIPFACMEGSIISASRTAASAAAAAARLHPNDSRHVDLGIVGAGLIARYVLHYLSESGWTFRTVRIADLNCERAERFVLKVEKFLPRTNIVVEEVNSTVGRSELVLFSTTASRPYLNDVNLFLHAPTVLHLSLRDLSPEIILGSQNVVDDIEHCIKASTSVHVTEQCVGHRDFISGTLADLISGQIRPRSDVARIFSPFGLGVLDLALGQSVYNTARRTGQLVDFPRFFPGAEQ